MSKASEWAKAVDGVDDLFKRASVEWREPGPCGEWLSGKPKLFQGRQVYVNLKGPWGEIDIHPNQALVAARWIIDTFGESARGGRVGD